jgi:hypothetical protein
MWNRRHASGWCSVPFAVGKNMEEAQPAFLNQCHRFIEMGIRFGRKTGD